MKTVSGAQSVTLTNAGTANLTISSITVTGEFTQTNDCGTSMAENNTCTIGVVFAPTEAGTRNGTLSILDNAAASPQIVSLSGTGTSSAPVVSLSAGSLDFGKNPIDETSPAQTITLTNSGDAPLSVFAVAFTGSAVADFTEVDTCRPSVAAGNTCAIAILFTPSSGGPRTASLSITDSAAGSPRGVSVSGTGIHYVILVWAASAAPAVVGYNVYRGTAFGGEASTPLNSLPISGTSYTDGSVAAGVTYYYVLRATDAGNTTLSAASNETSASVPSP